MDRRHLLKNSLALGGLVGLGATAQTAAAQTARVPLMDRPPPLVPIRAHVDRIYDIKSLHPAVPHQGPQSRRRADRRRHGGAQLRPWR